MGTQDLPAVNAENAAIAGGPHNFNVSLSEEHYGMLKRIATQEGMTKVQVLRRLIVNGDLMFVHNIPVCVTGNRCFCPQNHPPPQLSPHQTVIPESP